MSHPDFLFQWKLHQKIGDFKRSRSLCFVLYMVSRLICLDTFYFFLFLFFYLKSASTHNCHTLNVMLRHCTNALYLHIGIHCMCMFRPHLLLQSTFLILKLDYSWIVLE